ncbi:MAG: NAD+ synthase [Candidatus Micrarchaeota archaeon]
MKGDFNPKSAEKHIVQGIKHYVRESLHRGVVLGVSGGVDSATCAMLAAKAVGRKSVLGLIMPNGDGFPKEVDDAIEIAKKVGIGYKIINIKPATEALESLLENVSGKKCNRVDSGNVAARTRMIALYDAASCKKYLVLGTGNKTELLLGYFTKYGDGGADLLPIGDLYKWQVKELAKSLGVPERIIKKKPTAGLWAGQTDEGEFGFSYDFADKVLWMFVENELDGNEIIRAVGNEKGVKKIYRMVKTTSHKRNPPRIFSLKANMWK